MHDPTLSLVKRGRLGRGVADRYLRGRHVDAADSTVLSGVTQTRFYYPPYSFDCPLAPRLQARLQITENVLVARSFDEVEPEVLLTGAAHCVRARFSRSWSTNRSKRMSFAELVAAAQAVGLLEWRDWPDEASKDSAS